MVDTKNLVIGIILIVLGALLVIGQLSLGAFMQYLGIILIVTGVLILVNVIPAGKLIGIVVLVLGILLQVNWIDLPRETRNVMDVVNLVVGVVLIVLGALKVLGRR